MSDLRAICTTPDGGVWVIVPAPECVRRLRAGSDYDLVSLDEGAEVDRLLSSPLFRPDLPGGERERIARKFYASLNSGGVSEFAAVTMIAEKDAPAGASAIEVIHASELPSDRTYRDAWRRSRNGGPIYVDDAASLEIDAERMAREQIGAARKLAFLALKARYLEGVA